MNKKRYEKTVVMYFEAENDKDAIKQAKEFELQQRKENDNNAKVLFIFETPYASLQSRRIYP